LVESIVSGKEVGHYFLIIGPKGSGKSTMIFEAMKNIEAEGIAVCEAHPDLEVFRLRLGKALNFEFNEDTQTVSL
jgi:late competence protein required for DNA uptake (superfamily II DNA/RNA helicase)